VTVTVRARAEAVSCPDAGADLCPDAPGVPRWPDATTADAPGARPEVDSAAEVLVRRAGGDDRAALEAMFLRCTPQTVYRRFHGPVKAFPASYLREALAGVPEHLALVAVAGSPADGFEACAGGDRWAGGGIGPRGRVVGLASCRLTESGDAAEIGLLVEDAWQGRGIGRELLRRLVAYGDCLNVPELQAQVLIEQDWIAGMLRPYGQCSSVFRPGIRELRVQRDAHEDLRTPPPAQPSFHPTRAGT
jgi:GNAT superfamily N-acetyltransferase